MYYVYVLKSNKNGRFYTGHTVNLERRFLQHTCGKDKKNYTCVNG
ncbi:MAG: GIY-YIG nuclease family protein, partial [Candidatus Omnitrophota bacterium]